ncbi:1-acyl-sn-glycerol-3-phosphate acyltransferase [Namhaeicola litoreus]|uniref:1-acyl-sn-glycerol-3-phosphate acyltransferase n=1 Tax=Namhaeicola litoreus TaxID=1052145 RepID=A0ABW3Y2Z5_9FLAO
MKSIWYLFLRTYAKLGFFFFYKKIIVKGTENIPANKPIMFVSNHPNALIDPLLVATTNHRTIYFFTRAAVFKPGLVEWFMRSANMLPVYRIRDGISTVKKNEAVFEYSFTLLKEKLALLIFAEGSHSLERRVRPLSKGFTRVVFGALEEYPDLDIAIVPIGINYNSPTQYGSKVSLLYSPPIYVNDFRSEDPNIRAIELTKATSDALKKIVCHIEDPDFDASSIDTEEYLDPVEFNQKLSSGNLKRVPNIKKRQFNFFGVLFKINSFLPLLFWKKKEKEIEEAEFIATYKYSIGITAFPIVYLIQALILGAFFGKEIALLYFIASLLVALIYVKTKH